MRGVSNKHCLLTFFIGCSHVWVEIGVWGFEFVHYLSMSLRILISSEKALLQLNIELRRKHEVGEVHQSFTGNVDMKLKRKPKNIMKRRLSNASFEFIN